jgi:hypothetical protein
MASSGKSAGNLSNIQFAAAPQLRSERLIVEFLHSRSYLPSRPVQLDNSTDFVKSKRGQAEALQIANPYPVQTARNKRGQKDSSRQDSYAYGQ